MRRLTCRCRWARPRPLLPRRRRRSSTPGSGLRRRAVGGDVRRSTRIAITHFHPDHVGGAAAAARRPEHPSSRERSTTRSASGSGAATTGPSGSPLVRAARRPAEVDRRADRAGHAFAAFVHFAPDPELLHEGSELARLDGRRVSRPRRRAHRLPERRRAHRRRPPPRADHAGGRPLPGQPARSARRLLASLERTIELAPRIAYPGHGEPIDDPAGRAREIDRSTTDDRLDETAAALADEPSERVRALARPVRRRAWRRRSGDSRSPRRSPTWSGSCVEGRRSATESDDGPLPILRPSLDLNDSAPSTRAPEVGA